MKVPALIVASAIAAVSALDRKFDGLNYDTRGYDSDGCKYPHQISSEFKTFAATTGKVRIYSMACVGKVLDAANSAGLKVWIGLWSDVPKGPIKDAFDSELALLKKAVQSGKITNDNVLGVQVASEALYRHYIQGKVAASDKSGYNLLVDHLNTVRKYLRDQKLYFPVTIADVMDAYNMFPDIYSAVDVVSVNQFSMWENKTAEEGVARLFPQWQKVLSQARAQGKPTVISETGWSTADDERLVIQATPAAQGVYTQQFLAFAETQSINYYYFSAIDLKIDGTQLIEKSFGIYDADAKMKPAVAAINVGKAPVATRLFWGDKVLKVDPANWNALSVGPPAQGLGQNLDNELWFYSAERKAFYSKSSNECLDAYGDANNALNVHVYSCNATNANQQWTFTDDSHLKNLNGANQCMDVDPNQGNKVQMWWCYDGPNQRFQKRDVKDEKVTIAAGKAYLYEWYGAIQATDKPRYKDNTHWFYDPVTQLLKSKSNNQCLRAKWQDKAFAVGTDACDASKANQKWQYNDVTGQWMSAGYLGQCLKAPSDQNTAVSVAVCDKSPRALQSWTVKLAN